MATNNANNSSAKPAAENKPAETKPALSHLSVAAPEKTKIPTIQEKLAKLEEFNDLVERREVLLTSLDNLGKFYISDSAACHIRLTDSKGNSFGIANPVIIGEIVQMSTKRLKDEVESIEAKLSFNF